MRNRLRDALNTGIEVAAELGELAVLSVARRWLGIPALEARVAELERELATKAAPVSRVVIAYGDDFADDSPRKRAAEARRKIEEDVLCEPDCECRGLK